MTPLAFELMKDLTTPGCARIPERLRKTFWRTLTNAHFFDVTDVYSLVDQQANKMEFAFYNSGRMNTRLAFLPATPLTWIETRFEDDIPIVFILAAATSTDDCYVSACRVENGQWGFGDPFGRTTLPLVGSGAKIDIDYQLAHLKRTDGQALIDAGRPLMFHFFVYSMLALINSPRVIGRRQHMPHERIERDKLKSLGLVGKFPLRAWTEIILSVATPADHSGEAPAEAHLTGEKCLHFCRTHLRWCNGRLEYIPVEGHWRGNPALGMKQSRYRIEGAP